MESRDTANDIDTSTSLLPIVVNVHTSYRNAKENHHLDVDDLKVIARVIMESQTIESHSDLLFEIDACRRALVIRAREMYTIELLDA